MKFEIDKKIAWLILMCMLVLPSVIVIDELCWRMFGDDPLDLLLESFLGRNFRNVIILGCHGINYQTFFGACFLFFGIILYAYHVLRRLKR